jgi:hypothetical protein
VKGYWVTIYERAGNDWKNRVEIANITPPAPPKPAQ